MANISRKYFGQEIIERDATNIVVIKYKHKVHLKSFLYNVMFIGVSFALCFSILNLISGV